MKRRRNIAVRSIQDHWDDPWSVFEIRPTEHGFPVFLGRPKNAGRSLNRVGGNRVILTTPLVEYLESRRHERGGWDLPFGMTTYKRLRKLLGLNIYDDIPAWWESHAEELASMTETAFAERHGYSVARVSLANTALFGRRLREDGWWKREPAASLLKGDSPRAEVAEQLGISIGAVGRLRWWLRHEATHLRDESRKPNQE